MIAALIAGHIFIDPFFSGIPLGYGILIGRASSRKWALFFAVAGLVFTAGPGAWMAYAYLTGGVRVTYPDGTVGLVVMVLFAASCLYVIMALRRSGHQEWFAVEKEETAVAKSLAWAVVAVAAFLHISQQTSEWRARKTLEQVYPFHVKVVPYNAENGKGLASMSFSGEAVNQRSGSKSQLPRVVRRTSFGGEDGIQDEFNGVASQPFDLTVHSEGFEDKTITVTRESEKVIRVPMQPLVATQPKQDADGKPAAPDGKK
ncbi:MAG: hypothetical protein J0L73_24910 [Verrucomicrobia bacterium]|nr:hypothetical protein [Verrucomicrobiota bacterium]